LPEGRPVADIQRILAFDIETVPNEAHLPPDDPEGQRPWPGTGTPPALHPITAHIIAVNCGWLKNTQHGWEAESEVILATDFADQETLEGMERSVVEEAFRRLAGAVSKGSLLVSFNGKEFDLPMLRTRAALLRLAVPAMPWRKLLYPYDDRDHLDLRLLLSNSRRATAGTLQTWATAFGVHAEERGEQVWTMVRAGKWSDLAEYGHAEGRTLVGLYLAVAGIL